MSPLKVLVACERSGVVRRAFQACGHTAYSCDLEPAEDGESEFHWQDDTFAVLKWASFDLVIAHPPCTRLCLSGVLRLYKGGKLSGGKDPAKWQEMIKGAKFFRRFFTDYSGRLCVENPLMHGHAVRRIGDVNVEQKQTIQPYQFGHDASKRTVLWLRGLPALKINPALYVAPRIVNGRPRWANQTDSGQNKLAPSSRRAMDRARTYEGIAKGMAEQWT